MSKSGNGTIKHARICHVIKRDDFDGYGFNLHSEKNKPGQYIGKIDAKSPAELAGLREDDRIIEVNGVNIGNETHKQVVQRIKAIANEVRLLVVDPEYEKKQQKLHNNNNNSNTSSPKSPVSDAGSSPINKNTPSIKSGKSTPTPTPTPPPASPTPSTPNSTPVPTTPKSTPTQTPTLTPTPTHTPIPSSGSPVSMKNDNNTINEMIHEINDNSSGRLSNSSNNNNNNNNNNIVAATIISSRNSSFNSQKSSNNNIKTDSIENGHKVEVDVGIKKPIDVSTAIIMHEQETYANNSPSPKLSLQKQQQEKTESPIQTPSQPQQTQQSPKQPQQIQQSPKQSPQQQNGNTNAADKSATEQQKPVLNLSMTAAEMRAKLLAKKKPNPKNDTLDLRAKFEIIQNL